MVTSNHLQMKIGNIFGNTALRTLLLANLIVSVTAMSVAASAPRVADSIFLLPSSIPEFLRHPWTILLYMFTQFGALHLFLNMLWLWGFGLLWNRVDSGSRPLVSLYLLCGVASGAVYLLFAASGLTEGRGLVGSSGAILGIIVAMSFLRPRERFFLFGAWEVELRWIALVAALLTLVGAGGHLTSSLAAHSGGAVAGWLWAVSKRKGRTPQVLIRKGKKEPERRYYNDRERLNELLDKINTSGFDSLTPEEKAELIRISR